jgi:UDP-N-acetyl-D-mannosaminuronic acid dehydrogenase
MLKELVSNDRIAGGLTPAASVRAKALYETFCTAQIFLTDARTAELAKLTENAFRDVNIAFANELSLICDRLKIDVWELIRLANRHPRVKILQPGPGVGGHCIAVDPWFIVAAAPEEARLMRTAREVNDHKPHHVVAQVRAAAAQHAQPVVACLGLAFKANVDDLRESPAVEITAALAAAGLPVLAVEPHVRTLPPSLAGKAKLVSLEEAMAAANVIVLLVDHRAFGSLTLASFADKALIDTRGQIR